MSKKKTKPLEEALLTSYLGEHDERKAIDKAIQDGNVGEVDSLVVHATKIQKIAKDHGWTDAHYNTCLNIAHLMNLPENQGQEIVSMFIENFTADDADNDDGNGDVMADLILTDHYYKVIGAFGLSALALHLADELEEDCRAQEVTDISWDDIKLGLRNDDVDDIFKKLYELARDDYEQTIVGDEVFLKMSYDEQLDYVTDLMSGFTLDDFVRDFGEDRIKHIVCRYFSCEKYGYTVTNERQDLMDKLLSCDGKRIELPGGLVAFKKKALMGR
ncbi:MAG: hypothetical protein COT74_14120 [Bdellovibrionales bacterium CG10_big_fil_rev_8_21_14_0_10_45_34]|nr:MAG: hypothetical protein COT74_14120 [Bdellovibrionales bacterium CG10_big_fil_rev_8_21_14_0_10_45_34]